MPEFTCTVLYLIFPEYMENEENTGVDDVCSNLPNGRVGHPYRLIIDEDDFPIIRLTDYWFNGLENVGLHFVPDRKQITGVPLKSGKFEIQLQVRNIDNDGRESVSTFDLSLFIEDDFVIPLEDSPSDENDPYWKPDEETSIYIVPILNRGWKKGQKRDMAAASKRGRLHVQQGKFREDDFEIKYDPESEWYMLAVADGAGASKYSRKGSQIACESVVESCFEHLATQSLYIDPLADEYNKEKSNDTRQEIANILHHVIASSVISAYREIEQEAEKNNSRIEDYATTLLFAICKKFNFGWFIGAFWVGDGAICVYNKDTWQVRLLGIPDGEDRSSPKRFLTIPEIIEPAELSRRICFTIIDDFSALFLMTNGVSDPKFEVDTHMQYFEQWNKFWEDISSEVDFTENNKNVGEELLKWLDFWTPGKHDDRTIAVVF